MALIQVVILFLFGFGSTVTAPNNPGGSTSDNIVPTPTGLISSPAGAIKSEQQTSEASSTSSPPTTVPQSKPSINNGTPAHNSTPSNVQVNGGTAEKPVSKHAQVNGAAAQNSPSNDAGNNNSSVSNNFLFWTFHIENGSELFFSTRLESQCLLKKMQQIVIPCINLTLMKLEESNATMNSHKLNCIFEACAIAKLSNLSNSTMTPYCNNTLNQTFAVSNCGAISEAWSTNTTNISSSARREAIASSGMLVPLVPVLVLVFPYYSLMTVIFGSSSIKSKQPY